MKASRVQTIALTLALSFFLFLGTALAEKQPWMHDRIMTVDKVIANVTVPMAENVMIVDSRPYKAKYIKGHIPGAVSIPFTEFDKKKELLPADKDALLIFYCGGLKCKLSHKSAKKAEAMGYTNVHVFAKGFPEWKKQPGAYISVSAEYVAAKIAENKSLIVDSRPQKTKFDKGHIPTAVSIPFSQFDALMGKLPRDLETPIVFYCGGLHCRLSHKSAAKAVSMGYKKVSVFSMGYPEWKKLYGGASQAVAVQAGEIEGAIDIEQFKKIITTNPDSIYIVDVRDNDEFAKGHFKNAVNIPVENLEPKIGGLPDAKPVVYVCSTGARSGEAYYMTRDVRESLEKVFYVEAEISFKSDGSFEIKKPE